MAPGARRRPAAWTAAARVPTRDRMVRTPAARVTMRDRTVRTRANALRRRRKQAPHARRLGSYAVTAAKTFAKPRAARARRIREVHGRSQAAASAPEKVSLLTCQAARQFRRAPFLFRRSALFRRDDLRTRSVARQFLSSEASVSPFLPTELIFRNSVQLGGSEELRSAVEFRTDSLRVRKEGAPSSTAGDTALHEFVAGGTWGESIGDGHANHVGETRRHDHYRALAVAAWWAPLPTFTGSCAVAPAPRRHRLEGDRNPPAPRRHSDRRPGSSPRQARDCVRWYRAISPGRRLAICPRRLTGIFPGRPPGKQHPDCCCTRSPLPDPEHSRSRLPSYS
jgi:hypothetical protein